MCLRSFAGVTLVAVMTFSASARADVPLTLDWNTDSSLGGGDCPEAAEVVAEVERILGGSTGSRRQVAARAEVTHASSGMFQMTLVTSGANVAGRRSVEAESCRELASASALILALTVNPQLTAAPVGPAPKHVETPPPPRESAAPPPKPRRSKTLGVSVAGAGDLGVLPGAAAGLEAAVVGAFGDVRVEAAGRIWSSSRATGSSAGADFRAFDVGLRGGVLLLGTPSMRVGPIAGIEVDHIDATGFGGTRAFKPSATWLSASGGGLALWSPFSGIPFALRASVDLLLPFSRPEFVVREPAPAAATPLHQTATVAGRATIGAELLFF